MGIVIHAEEAIYQLPLMLCFGIIFIALLILTLLFITKYLKEKNKRNLIIVIVSIILIIGTIGFEIYLYWSLHYQLNRNILEYSLELESNSEQYELVYVPISSNKDLQNFIKIKSGTGSIEIIDTEHGLALKVDFMKNIEIYGKFETTSTIGDHDLTMVNQTEQWCRIQYWIYYEPYNSTDYNCSIELKFYHEAFDWWETHYCKTYLIDKWNTYWADHEALS